MGGHRLGRCLPWLLGIAALVLHGCGGNARAPVEDRYLKRPAAAAVQSLEKQSTYRVQRGETLYSIAFRYGLDFRKVAAANQIPAPYTIYPGQTILMREGALPARPARPEAAPRAPQSAPSVARPEPAQSQTVALPPLAKAPAPAASVLKPPTAQYTGAPVKAWRWPARGKVTRGYSASVHKGIDISGRRGDPVVAVSSGKVVYAGAGIVGFGELLIIKHNELYLSAYGHNDRLLVSEGQVVTAGEKIAEMGSSGTDSVKLHFEIRKEGKPIDPQRLLPRSR